MGGDFYQPFSKEAREKFQCWLETHEEHPYPTSGQIKQWREETDEKEKKIKTWFYKARAARGLTNRQLSKETKDKLQSWLTKHKKDPYPTSHQINQWADETNETEGRIKSWLYRARGTQGLTKVAERQQFKEKRDKLQSWVKQHNNFYPTLDQKKELAREHGLEIGYIHRWFSGARETEGLIKRQLSKETRDKLRYWAEQHNSFYPTLDQKRELARENGLEMRYIHRWFEKARKTNHGRMSFVPSSALST